MSIQAKLRAHDPDLVNLRKALRAALVAASVFAVLKLAFDSGPIATYGFFASLVGLIFANFGGPLKSRALAYAGMIVIGNVLVVVGALLSDAPVAATIVMFVIIFLVSFATVFGGYAPSFMAPVALSYSLAVLDPISDGAIDVRVIGWTIGGISALIAALVLWPIDRRPILRRSVADVCDGLAIALESINDRDAAEAGYQRAVDAFVVVRRKTSTPLRPVGPMSRDIGLMLAIEHVEQSLDMTRRVLDRHGTASIVSPLYAACARSFRQSGALLRGELDPKTASQDMPVLEDALFAERQLVEEKVTQNQPSDASGSVDDVLDGVRHSFPLLALSHIAMWVEANAATALGAGRSVHPSKIAPELKPISDRPAQMADRFWRIMSQGVDPDGVIFRNSIRAAAAMSLAVAVAQIVPIEHGFWITLAALVVLHSSASSTTATALQAIVGTVLGFVVAAGILLLFQSESVALWVLLPICIFLSGYVPGVVSFMVGQMAFTCLVVVLFTLIDPVGITTAVLRVETVALGAASGGVMAFILWPRGARVALARAVASVYRVSADGIRSLTASDKQRHEANANMHGIRRHAEETLTNALSERGRQIDIPAWMTLFQAPNMAQSIVAGLWKPPSPWLVENCGDAVTATFEHRSEVADALDHVADRLDPVNAGTRKPNTMTQTDELTSKLMGCIDSARPLGMEKAGDVIRLIALNEWLSYIDEYIVDVEPELAHVVEASRPGAWLRWSLPTMKRRHPSTT